MQQGKSALNTFANPCSANAQTLKIVGCSKHCTLVINWRPSPHSSHAHTQHSSRNRSYIASQRGQRSCSVFLLFDATHCGPLVFFHLLHVVRTCTPKLQSHPIAARLVSLRPTRVFFSVPPSPTGARCPFLSHVLFNSSMSGSD